MKKLFYSFYIFLLPIAVVAQCDSSSWMSYDTSNSDLVSNHAHCLMIDNNNKLWVGHGGLFPDSNGLSSYDGITWTYYNEINSGLPADAIYSLCPDDSGKIWIGTGLGLAMFDGITWTVYTTSNSGIISDVALTLAIDLNGKIWIGTPIGVSVFDGSTWTSYTTSNSPLAYNGINSLIVDQANNVWIGTENGLSKYNQTGNSWTLFNTSNSAIPSNAISSVEVDLNGKIWLGFGLGFHGVVDFNGLNWNYHYPFTISSSTWVSYNSIRIDAFNNIWVGSICEGLFYYNGIQWIHCTPPTQAGFDCSSINYPIAFDNNNNIWYGDQHAGVWTTNIPDGIKEQSFQSEILIYPNPVSDNLIMEFPNSEKKYFSIYNVLGKEVLQENFSSQKYSVDVSSFARGIYIAEVRSEKSILRRKFVKE